MSQPKISDSLIAQIAGNVMSTAYVEWRVGGSERDYAVRAAVATARAIVAEVERTRPVGEEEKP